MAKAHESKERKVQFLHKPSCTSCRNARALLEGEGVELAFRDLDKERLSVEELDHLIGNRDYRKFLNSRNELYRERKMGEKPPTRAEALRLMAATPNLIRRPVVISGGEIILGFDEEALKKLAD
jgi:arsenate reductase